MHIPFILKSNMAKKFELVNNENIPTTHDHELKMKKATMGLVGKIFGSGEGVSKNVAGVTAIIFVILICIVCIFKPTSEAIEIGKLVIPVITLIIGFMFGKKS